MNIHAVEEALKRDVLPLVQPIVVLRSGSHEDVVAAVAVASVTAWLNRESETLWDEWLAGAYGKTVRRAKPAQFARVLEEVPQGFLVVRGEAKAYATSPFLAESLPVSIRKLQVSGTNMPVVGWQSSTEDRMASPIGVVNDSLEMTTGKTAAQAAHALLLWAVAQSDVETVRSGLENVVFVGASQDRFDEFSARSNFVVVDAGRTELNSYTKTVCIV